MAILVLAILINHSYLQLNALKPGIYICFLGLRLYWHCPFSCVFQTEDIAAILILSLIFYYWHNILGAVVSHLWTFRVTASAEGCLSARLIFSICFISRPNHCYWE